MKKLHEHYQFFKGEYSGIYNTSYLFLHLVRKTYDELFGKNAEYNSRTMFDIKDFVDQINKKFGTHNIRRYSKEQMVKDCRNICVDILRMAEKQIKSDREVTKE